MSLSLAIKGIALRIYIETEAQMEHINPMLADGMEDGFSLPFELPALGNEKVLEYVHELPLHQRTILFDDATLGHAGIQLFPGTLRVLGSTKDTVRTNFTQEGFVERARSVMLPDTLRALEIDIFSTWYDPKYFPTYADGGPCRFPMHYNPSLYGSENPDWMPDAQEYSATQAYEMNKLVRFSMPADNVQREEIWQCTIDTTAGESPSSHPAKWRRTAFGIVNAWNKEQDSYYYNGSSGNFYALVPWFYLKYVLHHALAHIGYRGIGDFVDDARTDEVCLPNSTTLDRVREINTTIFFRALDDVGYSYTTTPIGSEYPVIRLQANTESPLPYQDAGDRWSGDTFTPDVAGYWVFNIHLILSNVENSSLRFIGIHLYNVHNQHITSRALGNITTQNGQHAAHGEFIIQFTEDMVGEAFHFRVAAHGYLNWFNLPTPPPFSDIANIIYYWPSWPNNTADRILKTDIKGWLQQDEIGISYPDHVIHPNRHVPDISLLDFLLGVADAFNLELDPDHTLRTLHINYREPVVRHRHRHTTYHAGRLLNDVELDHTRAIEGARVKWDIETMEEGLQELNDAPVYDNEADVPQPYTSGMLAVLRNTREVLKSAFVEGGLYVWNRVGYHHPPYGFGDADNGRTMTPAAKPLQMIYKRLDGEDYMMPMMDEQGTSAWFLVEGDRSTIHLCEMCPASSFGGNVANVPGARSWGYGWTTNDRSRLTLELHNADPELPGMGQQYWHHWLQTLLYSEPVTIDLLLDAPFLLGRAWKRPMHMQGQEYLIHRMPVTYGREQGLLISEGAFALRLMPSREYDYLTALEPGPDPEPEPLARRFTITLTGSEGNDDIYLVADQGIVMMVPDDPTSQWHSSPWALSLGGSPRGTYSFYPAGADLEPSQEDEFSLISISSYNATAIDLSGLVGCVVGYFAIEGLTSGTLVFPAMSVVMLYMEHVTVGTLDLSMVSESTDLSVADANVDSVVMPAAHSLVNVGIDADLSAAAVNAILANLRANNFTGSCDLSGTNAAPTLQGIADKAWLIDNGATIYTN